ncbi:MAG: cupin domain-containing protein [Bacteroidales bacterium]|nr:cupin domain-containing protein [Bacteroidales bacterium]
MKQITFIFLVLFVFCFNSLAQYNKGILIEPVLKTDTTSIGQKIIFPSSQNSEVSISKITIPSGDSTGWHKHDYPVFAYVLKGTLNVKLEHGETMQFPENSCFAEVVNTFHNGFNNGKENVVLIGVYLGEKGKPLSVKK